MGALGDFGSTLDDVDFNSDGSLKITGKQAVKFYLKKRLAFKAKRDENGELIMDKRTGLPAKEAYEEEVEFVNIKTKGDTNEVDDVANDLHRKQFYRSYKFFRDGKVPDGNPIEDFDFLQPSTVMELHYYGIHVVQQVATMEDVVCERLKDQSGYEIRDIAAQWVKINSPQGANLRLDTAEKKIKDLERELEAAKAGRSSAAGSDGLPPPLPGRDVEPINTEQAVASRGPGRPRTRLVE